MSGLPDTWQSAALGQISQSIQYGYTASARTSETGPRFLRITDIQNGNVDWSIVPTCDISAVDVTRHGLSPGDIVFARIGATTGKSFLIRDCPKVAVFASYLIRVRPKGEIVDPRLLSMFFQTPQYWRHITENMAGVAQPTCNASKLAELVVPLPPLPEQKRIADKLDTLLARVDTCRSHLARVPAILKRFRQSVLAAATSGELTSDWRAANPGLIDSRSLAQELHEAHAAVGGHKAGNAAPPTDGVHDLAPDMFPMSWSLVTLRELVQPDRPITYGILKPGPELDEGVPYVRVADFPNERLNLTTIRKTSLAMDEEFRRSRLAAGDLLLSIRGTVGRLITIPPELEKANITQDSARLSIQACVSASYVLWTLRSELVQQRMKGAIKGVAVRGINIGDVRALQIPLPSTAEQAEIVRRVEYLFALGDQLEVRYTTARTHIDRLTPALLAKAFRGELVPQQAVYAGAAGDSMGAASPLHSSGYA